MFPKQAPTKFPSQLKKKCKFLFNKIHANKAHISFKFILKIVFWDFSWNVANIGNTLNFSWRFSKQLCGLNFPKLPVIIAEDLRIMLNFNNTPWVLRDSLNFYESRWGGVGYTSMNFQKKNKILNIYEVLLSCSYCLCKVLRIPMKLTALLQSTLTLFIISLISCEVPWSSTISSILSPLIFYEMPWSKKKGELS